MSSTEPGRSVRLAAYGVIVLLCYGLLVAADAILAQAVHRALHASVSEADAIRHRRLVEEDIPARDALIAEGYRPMVFPRLADEHPDVAAKARELGAYPLAPQPDTPLYHCNEGYGFIRYRSDRYGFRNPDALWDGPVDTLLIGDSFVHGACVADEATMARRLPGAALNLGSASNNPLDYAALADVFVPLLRPRHAVVVFYANDNGRSRSTAHDWYRERPYVQDGALVEPLAAFYRWFDTVALDLVESEAPPPRPAQPKPTLRDHLSLATLAFLLERQPRSAFDASQIALETLARQCVPPACTPLAVYVPNSRFWHPDRRADRYADRLGRVADALGLRFVDTRPLLDREKGSADYAPKGPHLSPAGYAKVAEAIAATLGMRP